MQDLFTHLHPLLGRFYGALRAKYPKPNEALHVLWGIPQDGVRLEDINVFSLIPRGTVFAEGQTVEQLFALCFPAAEAAPSPSPGPPPFSPPLSPSDLLTHYKTFLAQQGGTVTRITQTPGDKVIDSFSQRRRRGQLTLPYVLEMLETLEGEGLTPLHNPRSWVEFWERLPEGFFGEYRPRWEQLHRPFLTANGEARWLQHLFSACPRDEGEHRGAYPTSPLQIRGAFSGNRQLSVDLRRRIFDAEGHFQRDASLTGRSAVTFYPPGPSHQAHLFFKKYPEIPGYEGAVTSFMRRLGIKRVPFSEVFAFFDPTEGLYPVLVSEAVGGRVVHQKIKDEGDVERGVWLEEADFARLDREQTALLILASMLLNPEDAKGDNFICVQEGETCVLVPIDNDHAFLPGAIYERDGKGSSAAIDPSLQTKSLVFCLPHMQARVPESVRERFRDIDVDAFVQEWMQELITVNDRYQSLVPERDLPVLWREQNSTLRIPFAEVSLRNLYFKFRRLQSLILSRPELSLLALLQQLEPYTGKRYKEAFASGPQTVRHRFHRVSDGYRRGQEQGQRRAGAGSAATSVSSAAFAPPSSAAAFASASSAAAALASGAAALPRDLPPVSVANSHLMMRILNIPAEFLTGSALQSYGGPTDGLELLRRLRSQESPDGRDPDSRADIEARARASGTRRGATCMGLSAGQERDLLAQVFGDSTPTDSFVLHQSRSLGEGQFRTPVFLRDRSHHLTFCDLRGARSLTVRDFMALVQACRSLEHLNLSGCPNLTHVAEATAFGIFGGAPTTLAPILLPHLQRLIVTGCSRLREVHLNVPLLEVLEANDCPSLQIFDLQTPQLQQIALNQGSSLNVPVLIRNQGRPQRLPLDRTLHLLLQNPELVRGFRALYEKADTAQGRRLILEGALISPSLVIPPIARGHEDVYRRFLRGVLVYQPPSAGGGGGGGGGGRIELPIAALANPLATPFDLSRCGDTGKDLCISTGYRERKNPANANKLEVWIAPRFLVESHLASSAGHFREIMGGWDGRRAPVGLFWTWGGWSDLGWYDYLTNKTLEEISSNDLYENYKKSTPMSGTPRGLASPAATAARRARAAAIACFVCELR